jgi:hypothetical protein
MITRVRILKTDGTIAVVDQTNSQFCELTRELTREQRRELDLGQVSMTLPDGRNVKVVGEVF